MLQDGLTYLCTSFLMCNCVLSDLLMQGFDNLILHENNKSISLEHDISVAVVSWSSCRVGVKHPVSLLLLFSHILNETEQ